MTDDAGINVQRFEDVDAADDVPAYIDILDAFDALAGIQLLKQAAIERSRIRAGMTVFDDGCGAGLETVRLARLVGPSGQVVGLDASRDLLAEARRRTEMLRVPVAYVEGDAQRLPFPDDRFDVARSERLFLYLDDPRQALAELARVTKDDGTVALIEPDFETTTINVDDRALVRKVLHFDCDHDLRNGWIGRQLPGLFADCGLTDVDVASGTVVYEPHAFSSYFLQIGRSACQQGAIGADEQQAWEGAIHGLLDRDELFCTITYFMVAGRVRR